MPPWPFITLSGAAVGVLTGVFGVGGSSVATPMLSLLGVAPHIAIASPLPATIPSALLAARPYVRSGDARPKAASWTLLGAVPATVAGALLSRVIAGNVLLVISGLALVAVGIRIFLPIDDATVAAGAQRRLNRPALVASSATVGLFSGLLANGGGFVLVPLYLLVFGLRMRQAVGTSLLVVAVLSVPTLITHWALGHIDWAVAGYYAIGALPGSVVASHAAGQVAGPAMRRAFGTFLVVFGALFTAYRLA